MFSSLGVSLNGKPVTLHESNYHDKAYLENLLNYGSDASGTHLLSGFWFLDSLLAMEHSKKTLAMPRQNYHCKSKTIELYGRLHADLFNSHKMLMV
jgi:hypothetical protein